MNDSGDITAKFIATEQAIDKLQQPTIEIERTRNAIRETEKRNEGVRAELEAIEKRIKKGYKAIRESSDGEQRIEEAQKEISRLGGLIAWQDNRSKQFKTIIERGY
jgi:septal ring factor EnvC (AmiA/AmiB activator)